MIHLHVYQTNGRRATVTIDGTDRAEAREYCHALVTAGEAAIVRGEPGAYRACIYDALAARYSFDTDDAWLAA